MSDWVEIPIPHGAVQDGAGNLLPYIPITLKLKGTSTDVTHAADDAGTGPSTGSLITRPDGSIGTIAGRRRVQSGQKLVMSVTIGGDTQTWEIHPISASVETSVKSSAVTIIRDDAGDVSQVDDSSGTVDLIVRDADGLVISFREYGTTRTVTRDSAGQLSVVV